VVAWHSRHGQSQQCISMPKSLFGHTLISFNAFARGDPCEYVEKCYTTWNYIHRAIFLSETVYVYLHSVWCSEPLLTDEYCENFQKWTFVGSWLFKVIAFVTNQKGICKFLLVIITNTGPILYTFGATATDWSKSHVADIPVSFNAITRRWSLVNMLMALISA